MTGFFLELLNALLKFYQEVPFKVQIFNEQVVTIKHTLLQGRQDVLLRDFTTRKVVEFNELSGFGMGCMEFA